MSSSTTESSHRTASTTRRERGGDGLAGTGVLVRFMLRRDRVKLPAWVGGLGVFVLYIANALPQLAPQESDLASTATLFDRPVGRMFTGPAYGLDDPTYARFFVAGYGLYFVLIAALMNIMLVVRHTRLEEQTGRAELVRANVTGRHSALTATLIVALITNALASGVIWVLMIASGYPVAGSLQFAIGVGAGGLSFAGISAIAVQLSEYSRGAAGITGTVLGVAFVVRMGGDMLEVGGTTLSWFSPLAWVQQSAPFVLDRWWVLLLPLILFMVTTAVGYGLLARRDLGASLIAVRPGRTTAHPSLGTPIGLAIRLQRGSIIGWGLAVLVLGVVDGAFAQAMLDGIEDMPADLKQMFGAQDMLGGYLAFVAVFTGYLTAAYAVSAIQGLTREESRGRAESVLATPTSRWAWLGSHVTVVAVACLAIMAVTGLGAGLAAAAVTGDEALVWDTVAAHLNLVAAPLVVLALAALLYGALPRLMAPISWALVGLMVLVGNFAALLDLPTPVVNLSPLSHPAEMPSEPFAAAPVIVLLVIAAAGIAIGLVAFRRRQVTA